MVVRQWKWLKPWTIWGWAHLCRLNVQISLSCGGFLGDSCFVAGGVGKAVKNLTSMVLSMVELPELFMRAKATLLYSKFLLSSVVTRSPICRNALTIANERPHSIPQFAPTIPMRPIALLVVGILVITILGRM